MIEGIGFLIGLAVGFPAGIWLMVSLRCENCCQKDKPSE